ncbi:MAG TPA: purine-nucleoside phosphorylase [Rhizobiaceae bacterium]
MTPHIEAGMGDYAERVLLPGDPARAAWIAATFLETPRQVNAVRGALGFTGTYRGMPVSVQATGIGRPSLWIYVHELLTLFGVTTLVRTGSAGSLDEKAGLRSAVIAQAAAMDFEIEDADAWRRPDEALYETAVELAGRGGDAHQACPMVSSDMFYHDEPLGRFSGARARGALACDMETAAIYGMAHRFGARTLSICTVVDSLLSGEEIARSERQEVFGPAARLALDTLAADWNGDATRR